MIGFRCCSFYNSYGLGAQGIFVREDPLPNAWQAYKDFDLIRKHCFCIVLSQPQAHTVSAPRIASNHTHREPPFDISARNSTCMSPEAPDLPGSNNPCQKPLLPSHTDLDMPLTKVRPPVPPFAHKERW